MSVGGTWGKLLHVDLTEGKYWVEEPSDDLYLKLAGGRGLVAYLLLRDMPAGADPLGPDNLLIFAPGPLQGSNLPGSGRHGVGGKSPLTGAIASAEAGGWWGHEFKRAGYDALIVRGKSEKPVYIWIQDGEVEIRDAAHLWGKDTADVEWAIQEELDDQRIRVSQCGIAGENQVLYANVMNDINRAAGRGGLGAVMGSKNLKAVATRGTMRVPVSERKRMGAVSKWLADNYQTKAKWAIDIGTIANVASLGQIGALPTNNFGEPMFEERDGITGQLMQETLLISRDTCQVCPIECKNVVEFGDERDQFADNPYLRSDLLDKLVIDKAYGGPEYETLGSFGSACGVDDLVAVAKANELSARWGMDSISLGMTIAYVMECVENGLLTYEEVGESVSGWGDAAGMLKAIDLIAHGEGFGKIMGEGSKRIAATLGEEAEQYLVEVKGQELPMHEPRAKMALGIGYATAPVGADHMMNIHDTGYTKPGDALEKVAEVQRFEPMAFDDLGHQKMELFYHEVNFKHTLDSAIVCHFYPYNYVHVAEALSGVMGHDYDARAMLAIGERTQTLCRLFNIREGFTADDDKLPKRIMKAFESGPLEGVEITDEAFYGARNYWYGLMGWTQEGVPTAERVSDLGLDSLLEGVAVPTV